MTFKEDGFQREYVCSFTHTVKTCGKVVKVGLRANETACETRDSCESVCKRVGDHSNGMFPSAITDESVPTTETATIYLVYLASKRWTSIAHEKNVYP